MQNTEQQDYDTHMSHISNQCIIMHRYISNKIALCIVQDSTKYVIDSPSSQKHYITVVCRKKTFLCILRCAYSVSKRFKPVALYCFHRAAL